MLNCVIWVALSTSVLISSLFQKEVHLKTSLRTLLQILSVLMDEKTGVFSTLQHDTHTIKSVGDGNQLNLFNF